MVDFVAVGCNVGVVLALSRGGNAQGKQSSNQKNNGTGFWGSYLEAL